MASAGRKYREANDPKLAAKAQARKLAHKQGRLRSAAAAAYREAPPGYSSESDIAAFEIDPAAAPEMRRIGADRILPEPLHIGQRAFYLGIQSADFPSMDAFQEHMNDSTEYFVLTPAEPMMKDHAFMTLSYPSFFEPGRNVSFDSKNKGMVGLRLRVEQGHTYLLDFVISTFDTGSYRFETESQEQLIEDLGGSYNHIAALLNAASPGWVRVSLKQEYGSGFELHAVAVTSTARP